MSNASFTDFALLMTPKINAALEVLLPQKKDGKAGVLPISMAYGASGGGKRLRPLLFLATINALGIPCQGFMPFAAGLEMIHCYSLIHDDLPSMDNDDFRRGLPSCHKKFGEGQAILAGDALLTHAFGAMIQSRSAADDKRLLDAMDLVISLAGCDGMIAGQSMDLLSLDRPAGIDELRNIYHKKTGALIIAAISSAAILCGANEFTAAALEQYAHRVGLAYQIADDIADKNELANSEENSLSKKTWLSFYSPEEARNHLEMLLSEAACAIAPIKDGGLLLDFLRYFRTV